MPEISVIVPVYRAEAFLRKCTESVLSQTFTDLELILVEDGSPDKSGELCDAIAAEDSRVRVIHKENGGVSSARNLGMEQARGNYIAFADADDWLPPDGLALMYDALVKNGADTAGGSHNKVELNGRSDPEPGAMPAGVYGPEEIRAGITDRLMGERMGKPGEVLNGFIWRFLFSRTVIAENHITFAGAYLEDELFLLEYFCHAKKLAMISQPVYYYLQNPVSVTRRYLPDYMDTFDAFMAAKAALANRFGLGENLPQWKENSNWSGLLIAIGNEFAPSNPAPLSQKRQKVKELCARPDMAEAIQAIHPQGLGKNKQMVADLVCKRRFFILSILYWYKNRNR
ncbi:MAG: glycosyltransferase [Ruminiclostridium sp.]|nr:glycosyltransferase [Ruminiclostridium sp.]